MAIDTNIYDKWDKEIATDEFNASVKDIEKNGKKSGGDFPEVTAGKYEVKIRSMELAQSKNNDPMLKVSFKILKGDFKNQLLWMNTVLTREGNIHRANEFLRSLDTDVEVSWQNNFRKYSQMILDVFEGTSQLEYAIDYSKNDKGYPVIEIIEVYEVE